MDRPLRPLDRRSPRGGIYRGARRPDGWQAPGPRPHPPTDTSALEPGPEEDLCWLAGDFRILQRTDGHRFSLDDLLTAYVAQAALGAAAPARYLDLGCGIGSVLLFLAWRFADSQGVGIEAQALSAEMARRSIQWNGVGGRISVVDGDLRSIDDPNLVKPFDLVTGTPPYFPIGTGLQSDHPQRGPCRFEHRGGPEDYVKAAARFLSPEAPFVMCAAALQKDRIVPAAHAEGLRVTHTLEILPRAGKAPLLHVYVLHRNARFTEPTYETLCVRDAEGVFTPQFETIRRTMGLPPKG